MVKGRSPSLPDVSQAPATCNAEIMAILLDLETFPVDPGTGGANTDTCNKNHRRNPQKHVLLNAKRVAGQSDSGIGDDLVYRDPWGNPYIISLDLDGNDRVLDVLYRTDAVSQESGDRGFNGLQRGEAPAPNNFEHIGSVMIWSLGPDGTADNGKANAGANKDNVLSWK